MEILNNKIFWIVLVTLVLVVLFIVFNARFGAITLCVDELKVRVEDVENVVYKLAGFQTAVPRISRPSHQPPAASASSATSATNASPPAPAQAPAQPNMAMPPMMGVLNSLFQPDGLMSILGSGALNSKPDIEEIIEEVENEVGEALMREKDEKELLADHGIKEFIEAPEPAEAPPEPTADV